MVDTNEYLLVSSAMVTGALVIAAVILTPTPVNNACVSVGDALVNRPAD